MTFHIYPAQLPVFAVSVLPVLGMLPVLGLFVWAVLACSCRVGVIRAVLGLGGPCRVDISVLACPSRACPALIYQGCTVPVLSGPVQIRYSSA